VITGIVDFNFAELDKNVVIIPYDRFQKLATLEGKTQSLYIYAKNTDDVSAVAGAVGEKLAGYENLSIKPYTSHPYIVLMEVGNLMMAIIYIVFMIVASFLIINTIIMVIHERIKEIGMMGALGMTRREIVSVFFLESLVLSGIGSVIGCIIGTVVTYILSQVPFDIGTMMEDMIAMNNTIYVMFSPRIIIQGLIYGLLVSGVCTIFPSLKSAFIKPVEAIRR
jgi:putative ABC transport system permease protein